MTPIKSRQQQGEERREKEEVEGSVRTREQLASSTSVRGHGTVFFFLSKSRTERVFTHSRNKNSTELISPLTAAAILLRDNLQKPSPLHPKPRKKRSK
jgi:hypothetical protein